MGLNDTPYSERVHIGIFGKRNAGKSSLINALTGQDLAIVSDTKGTTTDPVLKSMELLPLGPVVFIDTPGIDDEGRLGLLRVQKAYQTLNKTDIALLVIDAKIGLTPTDQDMLNHIRGKGVPYLVVINKIDLSLSEAFCKPGNFEHVCKQLEAVGVDEAHRILVSAKTQESIHDLKERIAKLVPKKEASFPLVGDLVQPHEHVILVVPIDKAAPKGRLILPQQQTIRDLLDHHASATVVQQTEYKQLLDTMLDSPCEALHPKLVITDSQVFKAVAKDTPADVPLTSFSILFARYKGNLEQLTMGAATLDHLHDGDLILISEGCTHHRQCGDIGTERLPNLIRSYTNKKPEFSFTSGGEFPVDLSPYRMIIHCGGCTLNEREMKYRLSCAKDANIPMTNYGIAIAKMTGILTRSLAPFSSHPDA